MAGVGDGNVGERGWQQLAAVWDRSYLTVRADGSQLCVWPGLWLRVRPGRDGEMEVGRRWGGGTVWILWTLGGLGWRTVKRKRRAPMKSVPGRSRPVWDESRSQPSRIWLCLSVWRNAAQSSAKVSNFASPRHLPLFLLHLFFAVSPSPFILILSNPYLFLYNGSALLLFFSSLT